MKVLYVSSDVSSIHINLLTSLEKVQVDNILCSYSINKNAKKSIPVPNAWYYESKSLFKGPILYLSRHRSAAKYFLAKEDLQSIDVMHGNMMFGDGSVCRYISEKTGIPYVLSVRNTDLNLWFLWKIPRIRNAGIENMIKAQRIIFLSYPYKKELISRLPQSIRALVEQKSIVIPNGADDFWFDNRKPKENGIGDTVRFLTVGRIEENKNQAAVAKAIFNFQKKRNKNVEYCIVGDCEDENIYKQLSEYSFVKIVPFQEKETLIHYFRENDIYIMPSHTETFGLVYVEAMTQGLPVIYTKGQGFDEHFEDGTVGYAVDSKRVDSIEEGIEKVVDHYDGLAQRAYSNCDKFKWCNISEQLKTVYELSKEKYTSIN